MLQQFRLKNMTALMGNVTADAGKSNVHRHVSAAEIDAILLWTGLFNVGFNAQKIAKLKRAIIMNKSPQYFPRQASLCLSESFTKSMIRVNAHHIQDLFSYLI
jgi:hypothetical protein